MGNSEVGHLNLGAGAVVKQDLTRIDEAVADGELRRERGPARRAHGRRARAPDRAGVRRRRALEPGAPARADRARGLAGGARPRAPLLHRWPRHAAARRRRLPGDRGRLVRAAGTGRIGSVVGPLLRDGSRRPLGSHPEGVRPARRRPRRAAGRRRRQAVREAYERDETDEFITPTTVGEEAAIRPGDSVLCFNFRPDRVRQLTRALAEPGFGEGDEELPGWSGRDGALRLSTTRA